MTSGQLSTAENAAALLRARALVELCLNGESSMAPAAILPALHEQTTGVAHEQPAMPAETPSGARPGCRLSGASSGTNGMAW